jgi:hypothetical protein
MLRQLDLIDRQAESAARLAPPGRARDRFDVAIHTTSWIFTGLRPSQ